MSCGMHLDQTLDVMEETRIKKKYADVVKKLSKELPFSYNEVESLLLMYHKFKKANDHKQKEMTKRQFQDVLHAGMDMTDTEICDVVTTILDKSPSIYFAMEKWVRVLALFLRGTLEEKIEYCFSIYNGMGDGKITRDQMVNLLQHSIIGEEDTEDVVKDLVEIVTKKMDVDRDGKISFNDFKETVLNQPLLLEAFGPCLPSRVAVYAFKASFTTDTGKL